MVSFSLTNTLRPKAGVRKREGFFDCATTRQIAMGGNQIRGSRFRRDLIAGAANSVEKIPVSFALAHRSRWHDTGSEPDVRKAAEVRVLTVANGDPQAEPPHRALTANTGQGLSQASGPRPPRAFRLLSPWFVTYWIEFDPKAPRCPIPPIRW
jgi:hypothetical protein